jgi:hypothetical protein
MALPRIESAFDSRPHLKEQAEALRALAQCLEAPQGHAVVPAVRRRLADLAGRQPQRLIEDVGLKTIWPGRAPSRMSFLDLLCETIGPELVRLVRDRAPRFDGTPPPQRGGPNLIDAVELFGTFRRLLVRYLRQEHAEAWREELGRFLLDRVAQFRDQATDLLGDADHPDIARIGRELLKVETLRWALELLDSPADLQTVNTMCRVVARRALGRAAEMIERFVTRRDVQSRFEALAVVVEAEELFILIQKIRDAEAEMPLESGMWGVREAGNVIQRFNDAVVELSQLLIQECLTGSEHDTKWWLAFRGRLRQITRLMLLGHNAGLPLVDKERRFGSVIDMVKVNITELGKALVDYTRDHPGTPREQRMECWD